MSVVLGDRWQSHQSAGSIIPGRRPARRGRHPARPKPVPAVRTVETRMSERLATGGECIFRASDFGLRSSLGIGHSSLNRRHGLHRTCHREKQGLIFGKSVDCAFPQPHMFPKFHRLWERGVPPLGRVCLAQCRLAIHNHLRSAAPTWIAGTDGRQRDVVREPAGLLEVIDTSAWLIQECARKGAGTARPRLE